MSQLLLGATIVLLILVGFISADIMGFAIWKSNKFPVEGKVGFCLQFASPSTYQSSDSSSYRLLSGHG
jgi:hypothetical protein